MRNILPFPEDFLLAQKCLEGEEAAIVQLRETHRTPLVNYLLHAGADPGDARELVEDLWADCLAEREGRKPRLATYAGNAPLQAWLKAVALNKLIHFKRRKARERTVLRDEPLVENDTEEDGPVGRVLESSGMGAEEPLLEIVRGAVRAAFLQAEPEEFVLLHLAHADELLGRELAVMFGCSESKISRDLEAARQKVREATLAYVRVQDPWLELKWEDFLELCRVVGPETFGMD